MVGCPRSGTSLLRNCLRLHSRLYCPEETHLFRWPFPAGSDQFTQMLSVDATLRQHRQLDGVSEAEFTDVMEHAATRQELQDNYMGMVAKTLTLTGSRWFDKTPQNVYGLLLISGAYPASKFIHMHRHPLNVVASLKTGLVMPQHSTRAGINMWLEAVTIVQEYEKAWPDRLLNVGYEQFTQNPRAELQRILDFVDEPWEEQLLEGPQIHAEQNKYADELTDNEVALIRNTLGDRMLRLGYSC